MVIVVVFVVAAVVVVAVVAAAAAAVVYTLRTQGFEPPESRSGVLQPLSPPVRPRTTQLRDRNFIAICKQRNMNGE